MLSLLSDKKNRPKIIKINRYEIGFPGFLPELDWCKAVYVRPRKRTADTILSLDELEEMVGNSTVEEAVEDAELSQQISAFLRTLRETDRNVFVRRYWFYDPIEKICERYGFGKGKVVMIICIF